MKDHRNRHGYYTNEKGLQDYVSDRDDGVTVLKGRCRRTITNNTLKYKGCDERDSCDGEIRSFSKGFGGAWFNLLSLMASLHGLSRQASLSRPGSAEAWWPIGEPPPSLGPLRPPQAQ